MPIFKKRIPEQITETADAAAQIINPRRRRRAMMTQILAILLIVAVLACGYFAYQYYRLQSNPQLKAQAETQQTLSDLSKVMILPNDSNPVVATITDKTKLQGQPFFKNAENGDRVVIFTSTMQAVLFRPSTGKIVNVAPLEQAPQSQQSYTPPAAPSTSAQPTTKSTSKSSDSTATTTK